MGNYKKNRRPRGYFSNEDNIIKEIKLRYDNGLKLNNKTMIKEDGGLISAAIKHFGSWENAIESAGYDYSVIQKSQKWTKSGIIEKIEERHKQGLSLNSSALRVEDSALYKACLNHFGSVGLAIKSYGLDYKNVKKCNSWSKESILNELNNRHENNQLLDTKSIIEENRTLFDACKYYFGSYEKAINASGLNYDSIRERKKWSKNKVIHELRKRVSNNLSVNVDTVLKEDSSLLNACIRYFGSYKNAIENIGLNYDDIREDTALSRYFGFQFEEMVRNILTELNINFSKGYNKEIRPDIVFSNNRWADAKLSEYTIYNCQTIEKYEPLCSMLTIVYLRGDKERDQMLTMKTRIISVFKLIKQLPKPKRIKFTELANTLWEEANQFIKLTPTKLK
jgi:hypothetical protein